VVTFESFAAVAAELVLTVVTYDTSSPYGPPLVRNFSSPGQQTRRSSRRRISPGQIVAQLRALAEPS
jgi:hypothetical protein